MNLSELRKYKNNAAAALSKLTQAAEQQDSPQKEADTRFWKLERDKVGNGSATIRFLAPEDQENDLPWVKYFSHAFQGPTGKWYIENSLTTFGEADPVSEANKELWDSGIEANKKLASARKRKLNYVSNILVIKDPAHPENEGKVFLFKYGKTIFDMIQEKLSPSFEDEKPVNVFDWWTGANLKLRMHTEDKYPKYTKSTWSEPAPLSEDDEEIVNIVNSMHDLKSILDRKNFKPYDQLKTRFEMVISSKGVPASSAEEMLNDDSDLDTPVEQPKKTTRKPKVEVKAPVAEDEDEDLTSFFAAATEED